MLYYIMKHRFVRCIAVYYKIYRIQIKRGDEKSKRNVRVGVWSSTSKKRDFGGRVRRRELSLQSNYRGLFRRCTELDLFVVIVIRFSDELRTEIDLDVRVNCKHINHLEVIAGQDLAFPHLLHTGFRQTEILGRLRGGVEPAYDTVYAVCILRSDTLDPADPFVACVRDIVGTLEDTSREVGRPISFRGQSGQGGGGGFGRLGSGRLTYPPQRKSCLLA